MLFPRLVGLTLIWVLATSAVTFAAGGRAPREASSAPVAAAKERPVLVVPDVRRQAYVFAKGILEDGGFAWTVKGSVQGYAANTVVEQQPAPGTRVLDNGSPRITLRLERNKDYTERGLPENGSAPPGTRIVLADSPVPEVPAQTEATPAAPPPATAPAPKKQPKPKQPQPPAPAQPVQESRKAAFQVPGAPAEPLDELPLAQRAKLLERRVAGRANPSPELVRFWLYQHAWIVTGAKFGWSDGAEALRTLIRVDEDLQARWGVGVKSEAVARAALAQVERRSR